MPGGRKTLKTVGQGSDWGRPKRELSQLTVVEHQKGCYDDSKEELHCWNRQRMGKGVRGAEATDSCLVKDCSAPKFLMTHTYNVH